MRTAIVGLVSLTAIATMDVARAATVGSIEGEVLLNRGDGYRAVKGRVGNVVAGAQLMVRPGGSAVIIYSSNCAVRVAAGVWSINEQVPCADGRDFIDFTGRSDRPVLEPTVAPRTETAAAGSTVSDTASLSSPSGESLPWKERKAAPVPATTEIGQPYPAVYKPTAGEAPPPSDSDPYRPPPPDASLPPEAPAEEQSSGYQTHHYLIMGTLVAAGAAGAAVLLSQGGDDKPASP